jgi:hypothetical protein
LNKYTIYRLTRTYKDKPIFYQTQLGTRDICEFVSVILFYTYVYVASAFLGGGGLFCKSDIYFFSVLIESLYPRQKKGGLSRLSFPTIKLINPPLDDKGFSLAFPLSDYILVASIQVHLILF